MAEDVPVHGHGLVQLRVLPYEWFDDISSELFLDQAYVGFVDGVVLHPCDKASEELEVRIEPFIGEDLVVDPNHHVHSVKLRLVRCADEYDSV